MGSAKPGAMQNGVSDSLSSSTPASHPGVDHNELNNIIDTLLEVRHNIRADLPDFGIKPVNLSEKQIEMLIEKS
jgi:hypothetical protein